ncbi:MAG: hypothetical protein LBD75_03220 [Candidatus Peribacteria bacterium]|nr:hypothetical protein [Candidatus Peribacteria bacterium]
MENLKKILHTRQKYLGISSLIPSVYALYPDDKNCRQLAATLETYFSQKKKEQLEEWKQTYPTIKLQVYFNKNYYFNNAKKIFAEYLIDDVIDAIVIKLKQDISNDT